MPCMTAGDPAGLPLLDLLKVVASTGYQFVTVTPATHQQVIGNRLTQEQTTLRDMQDARGMRDIFGWNLPFSANDIAPAVLERMQAANAIVASGESFKSRFRIASLDGTLFF